MYTLHTVFIMLWKKFCRQTSNWSCWLSQGGWRGDGCGMERAWLLGWWGQLCDSDLDVGEKHFKSSNLYRIWRHIEISDMKKERRTFEVEEKNHNQGDMSSKNCYSGWFKLWGISKALAECLGESHSIKGSHA